MESSENPYASPELLLDPTINARIQSLKWLRGAAIGIIFFASCQLLGGMIWFCALPFVILEGSVTRPPAWMLMAAWACIPFLIARAVFMLLGANHMRSGKHYRSARRAAYLAILGIVFPYFWWEVPFGVWALILLRKEKYKQLFES